MNEKNQRNYQSQIGRIPDRVIVIVGSILGAFALEQWNDDRKEMIHEITNLNDLTKELNADAVKLTEKLNIICGN